MKHPVPSEVDLPKISPRLLRLFAGYNQRYLRKHFSTFRILASGLPALPANRPVVIYLNHASWWDPLVCLHLARELFPRRSSFAPIEATMLKRYTFFKHLGFFGIEPRSARGGLRFLKVAHRLFASPETALWLTPQGEFADVRQRPVRLQNGLGHLAASDLRSLYIPLAIEYPFWTEPRPEILATFGSPIAPECSPMQTAEEWTRTLSLALEQTQETLTQSALQRRQSDWIILNKGSTGITPAYDTWRRLKAWILRDSFSPRHLPDT